MTIRKVELNELKARHGHAVDGMSNSEILIYEYLHQAIEIISDLEWCQLNFKKGIEFITETTREEKTRAVNMPDYYLDLIDEVKESKPENL